MRTPRSNVPAHATHDELLVARLAGRDVLDPGEHATATALVEGCADCALLAADIVAISRAVATEPVPPRRRDFRITPEQAAQLRGSPLRRLVGRLTLPSTTGALRPLATGALSIGLVLVFVGSVVPRGVERIDMTQPPAPQADRAVVSGDTSPAAGVTPPPAGVTAPAAEMPAPAAEATSPTADEELADGLGAVPETMALEAAPAGEAPAEEAPAAAAEVAEDAAVPELAAEPRERTTVETASPLAAASPVDEEPVATLAQRTVGLDAAGDDAAALSAAVDDSDDGQAARPEDEGTVAAADASGGGPDLGPILVASGAALIAVGLILALLLALSRRHPDAVRP